MINKNVNKGKASQAKMEKLHGLIVDDYIRLLESGVELTPGHYNAMQSFLKQNNIATDMSEAEDMANILESYQDFDLDKSLEGIKKIKK